MVATTEDGIDQITQECTVKPTGQTLVCIQFQPIRNARLAAEAAAADEAAREAQAEAEREAEERAKHEAQEQAAHEREAKVEAEHQPWIDPATGLMWTKNGKGVFGMNWPDAMNYCRDLRLEGHDDWRLPTIDELTGIYEEYLKGHLFPIGADLKAITLPNQASGAWSGSRVLGKKGKAMYQAWAFLPSFEDTNGWGAQSEELDFKCCSAWCVRRASDKKISSQVYAPHEDAR